MIYALCKYLRLYDMVAVCVLSHGDDGVIITADGQKVSYEDVEQGIGPDSVGTGSGSQKKNQKVKWFTCLFLY